MARIVAIAILALTGVGCNGSDETTTVDIATLFPANNEVGSWAEDSEAIGYAGVNPSGIEVAENVGEALNMINGDADVFDNHSFVALGREFYTTGDAELELRIWEFPSAAAALDLYDGLPSEDSRYDITWNTSTFGDTARMIDTGVSYWYNVQTGSYFVEVMGLAPNNVTTQTAGEEFLSAVLSKIP